MDKEISILHKRKPELGKDLEHIILDNEKKYLLKDHRWHLSNGYAVANINGEKIKLHHLIAGKPPKGLETDHINRNKLDNRRSNLRHISHRDNILNRDYNSKSGFRYVYYDKSTKRNKPYKAVVKHNNKTVNLGYFAKPEEASVVAKDFLRNNS